MAITTGKVRASYVHIFQPQMPKNGGDPKYSVTLLIPKTDIATINAIRAEIEKAKQEGVQKTFKGVMPPNCRDPLHDGDGLKQSGVPFGSECKGHMVMTASAKLQPAIVGVDMQPIINPAEVYSGCYIRASLNFFAYDSSGNRGIGCGLNAIQKIEDGEPLTARISAEEAFGGENLYTEAAAYGKPAGYGVPTYAQADQIPAGYGVPTYAQAGQIPAGYGVPTYAQAGQIPAGYGSPAYAQPNQPIDPITGGTQLSGGIMGIV